MHEIKTIRDGKLVSMHKCSLCWPFVSKTDNGYVIVTQPVTHAVGCPYAKEKQ